MSVERRKIIQAYGAELVLIPGEGMKELSLKQKNRCRTKTALRLNNSANPEVHEQQDKKF